MENEIWKDIPDYEGLYQASNLGRIRSLSFKGNKRIKIRKQHLNICGYYTLGLYNNNKTNTRSVHRMVAFAFLGKSKLTVNHKNGIKIDNNINNLEFMTSSDNIRHSYIIGLHDEHNKKLSKKLKNGLSKDSPATILTEEQVIEIKELYKPYKMSQRKLAKIYGVSQTCIFDILNGRSWNKLSVDNTRK